MFKRGEKVKRTCRVCKKKFVVYRSRLQQRPCERCSAYCRDNEPLEMRFWGMVRKTRCCWLWTGHRHHKGHGTIKLGASNPVPEQAHRVSWMLHKGPIPDGLCVLHNCPGGDNPACVNPAHLWLGTKVENTKDMVKKGTHARGERMGNSVLKAKQVLLGIRLRKQGYSYPIIARKIGVSVNAIWDAVTRGWKHLCVERPAVRTHVMRPAVVATGAKIHACTRAFCSES